MRERRALAKGILSSATQNKRQRAFVDVESLAAHIYAHKFDLPVYRWTRCCIDDLFDLLQGPMR